MIDSPDRAEPRTFPALHIDALVHAREKRWVIARLSAGKDRIAEEALVAPHRACTVYFPKVRKTVMHARKIEPVLRPFLPSYGFVLYEERVPQVLRSTPGVISYVRTSDGPVLLQQVEIDRMRAREVGGAIRMDDEVEEFCGFKRGDELHVADPYSPFYDSNVIYRMRDGKSRVKVWLAGALLGHRNVEFSLPVAALRKW